MRAAVPGMMLGARLSVTEWAEGGLGVEDGVAIAAAYRDAGIAYVCASSGGNRRSRRCRPAPATRCISPRRCAGTGVVTRAVGLIDDPRHADEIVRAGRADMVALGRAFLADPRWAWRAAAALGHEFTPPPQYARAAYLPKKWSAAAA